MEYIKDTVDFFNHPFFIISGGISVTAVVLGATLKIASFFFGITPLAIRFGIAVTSRKIGIVGSTDRFLEIRTLLTDSKIFKEKNISHVSQIGADKIKALGLVIVDWESSQISIDSIFTARQSHQVAVIVLAKPGGLDKVTMTNIANRANTVVVNFLGRLLNDTVTSLLTTSYER